MASDGIRAATGPRRGCQVHGLDEADLDGGGVGPEAEPGEPPAQVARGQRLRPPALADQQRPGGDGPGGADDAGPTPGGEAKGPAVVETRAIPATRRRRSAEGEIGGQLEGHHAAHRVADQDGVLDLDPEHGRRRATRRRDCRRPAIGSIPARSDEPGSDWPWPRRSTAMTRWWSARSRSWWTQRAELSMNPWSRTTGGPWPRSTTWIRPPSSTSTK